MIPRKKIIRSLFFPATALMKRLDFTRRFIVLGLLLSIAVAVVLYNLHQSLGRVIHTSRMELEGVALVKPFSRTLQLIQRHRGLSSALLNGAEALRDRRALTEKEAADAFDTLQEKLPRNITAGDNWQSIKADWSHIQEAGLAWPASENFDTHSQLVSKLLDLEGVIADNYELSLDPDFDSYYLFDTLINHLPLALEHLGQIRAYGASILATQQVTEAQKAQLNRLFGEFSVSLRSLKVSLAKTGQYNRTLHAPLSAASGDFSDSSRKIIDQVYSNILNGSFAMSAEDFFMMATAVINGGYAQIDQSLVPEMEALLKARIARAENTLRLSIGIALLLFMVVVYCSLGIYFAASESIRSLARSAHIIAAGNLHERVNLDTRNELKQVGDSFNEMAEGFQQLLAELRQSEERWKFALEGGGDGVWDWNIGTGEFFFSRRCKEVLGITGNESETYKNWESTIHPDLQAYLDGKTESYYNEHRIVLKDGSWKWILDRGMVVSRSEDGKPLRMIGTRTDITERKQIEAELIRSNAELEQFAYAVSHDMRQPLRMVSSYLSLIENALEDQLNEETRQFLDFAMDGAKRMDAMILSLLDYSRVGRKTEAKTRISSKVSLDEALAFLNPELKTCGGEINVTGEWPELFASHDELTRLLQNLIGNALKYHEHNQPPQVDVHGAACAESLRVEIRDHGIGIEPSQLDRLFKVFSRLQARSRFDGTGVGLALCRKIVEHHDGIIGVESAGEGQGCVFWFELPLLTNLS